MSAEKRTQLAERVVAASIIRQVRAGAVQQMIENVRAELGRRGISADKFCANPKPLFARVMWPWRVVTGLRATDDGTSMLAFGISEYVPPDAMGHADVLVLDVKAAAERVSNRLAKADQQTKQSPGREDPR